MSWTNFLCICLVNCWGYENEGNRLLCKKVAMLEILESKNWFFKLYFWWTWRNFQEILVTCLTYPSDIPVLSSYSLSRTFLSIEVFCGLIVHFQIFHMPFKSFMRKLSNADITWVWEVIAVEYLFKEVFWIDIKIVFQLLLLLLLPLPLKSAWNIFYWFFFKKDDWIIQLWHPAM